MELQRPSKVDGGGVPQKDGSRGEHLPEVHPVTSSTALYSWQLDEGMAVEIGGQEIWDRPANAILVTDAELALEKDWPAPLR